MSLTSYRAAPPRVRGERGYRRHPRQTQVFYVTDSLHKLDVMGNRREGTLRNSRLQSIRLFCPMRLRRSDALDWASSSRLFNKVSRAKNLPIAAVFRHRREGDCPEFCVSDESWHARLEGDLHVRKAKDA